MNEPGCLVNNYLNSSAILVETFKNFLLAFVSADFKTLVQDERLIVGSIILEYLSPLLVDKVVFEALLMEMLRKLLADSRTDAIKVALVTFEAHFPPEDYRLLIQRIVSSALNTLLK